MLILTLHILRDQMTKPGAEGTQIKRPSTHLELLRLARTEYVP